MARRRSQPLAAHPVVLAFLILAIIGFMALAGEVLKPLALAVLLSFALAPAARFLERRGLPRVLAVIVTVVAALAVLAVVGYIVGKQLGELASHLPEYREALLEKLPSRLDFLKLSDEAVTTRLADFAGGAARGILEFIGVGSFVLILVLFMLVDRGDLSDRIVHLFGRRQVAVTTRAMEEAGQRISRYLGMFSLVNSAYGLIIGVGLWAIGVPLATLWGALGGLLRFIPYVGPATGFVLPLAFSMVQPANGGDWWVLPLEVVVLFGVVETALNSFLEPVLYGRTTGVSALGLLVAAMFWTWLWGVLGLLLSTPLTVCLAVMGKSVPGLGFFATLLGEDAELDSSVRFYQRLIAWDEDGAGDVIEEALQHRDRAAVFDAMPLMALARANRDYERDELDDQDRGFIWWAIAEVLDDIEGMEERAGASAEGPHSDDGAPAQAPPAPESAPASGPEPPAATIAGVAVQGAADALALKMLARLLAPEGVALEIVLDAESPAKAAEQALEQGPQLVILSALPPGGLTRTRHLIRRLRARSTGVPILVGRWCDLNLPEPVSHRLKNAGAAATFATLAEARAAVLAALRHDDEAEPTRNAETRAAAAVSNA